MLLLATSCFIYSRLLTLVLSLLGAVIFAVAAGLHALGGDVTFGIVTGIFVSTFVWAGSHADIAALNGWSVYLRPVSKRDPEEELITIFKSGKQLPVFVSEEQNDSPFPARRQV